MSNPFISLLEHGFSVFPLAHADKEPPKGFSWKRFQSEKATIKQCEQWLKRKYNVGIATGKLSGFFVYDIDGEAGAALLREFEERHGKLPHTVTVKTNKGKHYYFGNPKVGEIRNLTGISAHGEITEGIDVRGEGGYVVAPPSLHPNGGNYEWINSPEDTPIADAPDWLPVTLNAVMQHSPTLRNQVG